MRRLRSFVAPAALWGLLLGVLLVASAEAAEIVDVRIGRHPTFNRLVFELDSPAGYRISRSDSGATPELVIAVEASGAFEELSMRNGWIETVSVERQGQRTVATVRLSRAGLRLREMTLTRPARIVIDVLAPDVPPPSERPPATAGTPTPRPPERTPAAAGDASAAQERALAEARAAAVRARERAERDRVERERRESQARELAAAAESARAAEREQAATAERAAAETEVAETAPAPTEPTAEPTAKPTRKPAVEPAAKPPPGQTAQDDTLLTPMNIAIAVGILGVLMLLVLMLRWRSAASDADELTSVLDAAAPSDEDNPFSLTADTDDASFGEPAPPDALDELPDAEADTAEPEHSDEPSPFAFDSPTSPAQEESAPAEEPIIELPTEPAPPTATALDDDLAKTIVQDRGASAPPDVAPTAAEEEGSSTMDQGSGFTVSPDSADSNSEIGTPTDGGPDSMAVVKELERRLTNLETRFDEMVDARERLERQVAAQTEELRVQRAAIARTQRAVRNLSRTEAVEDQPTEPALRDPDRSPSSD